VANILEKLKKPYVYLSLIVLVAAISFLYFRGGGDLDFDFAPVERVDLEKTIDVTGRVLPASSVNLAFENSGKIGAVSTDVGDRVLAGETLVSQVTEGILADLAQARARLKSEESKLVELERGSRPEEIAVQEIKVSNAKIALEEAKQALVDEIKNSFTKIDDAIRNKVDQIFSNPTTNNPKIDIQINNSQDKNNAESNRVLINKILNDWKFSIDNLFINSNLELKIQEAKDNISITQSFLEDISLIVNNLEPTSDLPQATIDGYKSDISTTARNNVNTASINLSTDIENWKVGLANLNLVQEELILMEAGSDPQAILSQEAKVEEAQASVQKFQSELNERFITAPIAGLVTFIEVLVGEIVSANEIVVSLISDNDLEIEANIAESDIVDISLGNQSVVELDAYGSDIQFGAKVIKINPAETIIDGVPIYETTFAFDNPDDRIFSGMTADIEIFVGKKENVLAVPKRAVFRDNGTDFVRIWDGKIITERVVETGFSGSDGKIEIISGVSDGENIITFITDEVLEQYELD